VIKVFSADNIVEVGLMRSLLEQHDIASELRNHHSSSLMGEVPFTSVWPELWVDQSKADRASQLIADLQREDVSGPDWICGKCKEDNPANFDICWQCGELISG
jgi:hypothetical protein